MAEGERQRAAQKREGAERKLRELQGSFDMVCRSPDTLLLRSYGQLDQLALPKLLSIQSQLCTDLDVIDTVSSTRRGNLLRHQVQYFQLKLS